MHGTMGIFRLIGLAWPEACDIVCVVLVPFGHNIVKILESTLGQATRATVQPMSRGASLRKKNCSCPLSQTLRCTVVLPVAYCGRRSRPLSLRVRRCRVFVFGLGVICASMACCGVFRRLIVIMHCYRLLPTWLLS